MGIIQNIIRKLKEQKEEKKHMEDTQNWQEQIEAKKMSNNERLLRRFLEEERQKRIKNTVEKFQKRENDEVWSGKKWNPVYADNMFKNKKNIFKREEKTFMGKAELLNGSNLFFRK